MSIASTGAAVAAAFRFFGTWSFGELSARNKVRRDFAAATGTQVAALANQHYWAIANASGTLNIGLRVYLRRVELSLYVDYHAHAELKADVDEVGRNAAANTLLSLARFIWALDDFQFKGSNDYLLPDYSAGRSLRRLYNQFRDVLPNGLATLIIEGGKDVDHRRDVEADYDLAMTRLQADTAAIAPGTPGAAAASSVSEPSAAVAKLWQEWLTEQLPNVITAAAVLQSFSRLLQHQLAHLYTDWFRDVRSDGELDAIQDAVEREAWPGALGKADLATIAAASEQLDFFGALSTVSPAPPTAPLPPGSPPDGGNTDAPQSVPFAAGPDARPAATTPVFEGAKNAVSPDANRFVIGTQAPT